MGICGCCGAGPIRTNSHSCCPTEIVAKPGSVGRRGPDRPTAGRQALPRTNSYAHARATYTGAEARSIRPRWYRHTTYICPCEESRRMDEGAQPAIRQPSEPRQQLLAASVTAERLTALLRARPQPADTIQLGARGR